MRQKPTLLIGGYHKNINMTKPHGERSTLLMQDWQTSCTSKLADELHIKADSTGRVCIVH